MDSKPEELLIQQGGNLYCAYYTIAQMMDSYSPFYESTVDIENAKALFVNIVIVGVTTTSNTIYSLLNVLLHHAKVYKKLQLETDAVIGRSRQPSIFDRESMPYANAMILEALQWHCVIPITTRKTLEDVTVGSFCFCRYSFDGITVYFSPR